MASAIPAAAAATPADAAAVAVGTPVRVRTANPATHCRTPHYLRGKRGVVVRHLGRYGNPEELAYHRAGTPALSLYMIEFDSVEVWGERTAEAPYRITADIFEHWLEPVDTGARAR